MRLRRLKKAMSLPQIHTCHSSMLIALSSCTSLVSKCIDWLSGLLRLMAVLWLWCRWIWPKCILRLSHSLRNSALRVYCKQNLKAARIISNQKNLYFWKRNEKACIIILMNSYLLYRNNSLNNFKRQEDREIFHVVGHLEKGEGGIWKKGMLKYDNLLSYTVYSSIFFKKRKGMHY